MRYCLLGFVLMMTWTVSLSAQSYHGWCTQGGTNPVTTGVPASQPFIRSFPNCTIGVTSVATGMAATLTDLTGASLPNPFMNSASGNTMTGDYSFVITSGPGAYNVQISAPGLTTYTFRINIGGTTVDCSTFAPPTAGAKLAACIAALPATGGVADATNIIGAQTITQDIFAGTTKPITLLLGAATYTISARQFMTANNSRITCAGTTIVDNETIGLWNISAADDTIEDCIINGGGAGHGIIFNVYAGAIRTLIRHNTINNYAQTAMYLANVTDARIINNTIFGGALSGISITTSGPAAPTNNVVVDGNRVDIPSSAGSSSGPAIGFNSGNMGGNLTNITVSNNILSTGTQFCVEFGAFNGNPPLTTVGNITVHGNTCTATANGTLGGYSSGGSGNENVVFSNNTYDGGGFTANVASIAAFEIAGVRGFAVTGNVIRNAPGLSTGFSVSDYADNGTISGNTISGFVSNGILMGLSGINPPTVLRNLTVSNNSILLGAVNNGSGIEVQCNIASGICRDIAITGNTIYGPGTANGSTGIQFRDDAGTMETIAANGNSIYGTQTGIVYANGTINGFSLTNNIFDAVNIAGSFGITTNGGTITNYKINNNTITSLNAGIPAYTLAQGIAVGPGSDGVIANNQVNGVATTAANQSGISVNNFTATVMERITISGNTVNAHGGGYGIWITTNVAGATVQDIFVTGNNVIGDGTTGSAGITWSTAGTMQRLTISGNKTNNFGGACIYAAANIVSQVINNRMSNCSTPLLGSGSNMLVVDYNGSVLAQVTAVANGSMIYVTDATISNPCAGGGTGAILKRLNGVNVCN